SRFQITLSNHLVPNSSRSKFGRPYIRNIGVSIAQDLGRNLTVAFSANRWYSLYSLEGFGDELIDGYSEDIGTIDNWRKGDVQRRFGYFILEGSLRYRISIQRFHEFYLDLGPSYAVGKNRIILGTFHYP